MGMNKHNMISLEKEMDEKIKTGILEKFSQHRERILIGNVA
jgi:hypothetical protein